MRCLFCQKGPAEGISIHRINAKGQPGVWACAKHLRQTDAKRDAEFEGLVASLSGKGR